MKKFIILSLSVIILLGADFKSKSFVFYKDDKVLLKTINNYKKIGLKYLNFLRSKAGEIALSENNLLDEAALNHAKYIHLNNILGHYEIKGYDGFTGVTPGDRAVAVGYKNKLIIENFSYGYTDVNKSIDGLFSAIYHRFGFLNEWINEIGIGGVEDIYVYDMGNSYLNKLCSSKQKEIIGAYYQGICADKNLKLLVDDVKEAKEKIEKLNKEIIIWPVLDVPVSPVFYEEDPDPLPTQSVSGYPISVKFNEYFYKKIKLLDFRLYDKDNKEIETILLDKETDPNNKLSDLEFALFPKYRLDWGSKYTAVFDYEINGSKKEIKWSFYTKSLPYPYYKVNSNEFNATILANKTYAFYFVPQDGDDKFNSVSVSYNVKNIDFNFIDFNTIKIKLIGEVGQKAIISLGNKKLILFIGKNENPKSIEENNLTEQVNKNYFKNILSNLTDKWELRGISQDVSLDDYNDTQFLLWKYKNNNWCIFTNKKDLIKVVSKLKIKFCKSIFKNEGFWIKKLKGE